MGQRMLAASLSLIILALVAIVRAGPASAPATKPSESVAKNVNRLTFLGNQLSADEAAIAAINKALVQAGYQAAGAAQRINAADKGNELMDRKGGGPVPWQEFYGRTARDFIYDDDFRAYKIGQPAQFKYVYRANDKQIEAAKTEAQAIGKKTDALLARRRELEEEQSSLWATLAFESIENRDIPLRPIYRNQLQSIVAKNAPTQPDAPQAAALRAAVLYLRTLDNATRTLTDYLEHDQGTAYIALRDTLKPALKSLEDSATTFGDTTGVDAAQAKAMMDLVGVANRAQSLCKDLCDANGKAIDADAAGAAEEPRKQLYRGALQESLFAFSEAAAEFDASLTKLPGAWGVHPQPGTKNTDEPLAVVFPQTAAAAKPLSPVPANARQVDLLKLVDLSKDTISGTWTLSDGKLKSNTFPTGTARIEFPYAPPEEYDYHIAFNRSQGTNRLLFVCIGGGHAFDWIISSTACGFEMLYGKNVGKNGSTRRADEWFTNGQRHETAIRVRKDVVQGYLDERLITEVKTNYGNLHVWHGAEQRRPDTLGIFIRDSEVTIEAVTVVEITGEGKLLR